MSRPMEHEEAGPVGAVSERDDGVYGVPMNSAESSATRRSRAGRSSICAGPGRFAQAQHQRLTRPKEAK